MRKNRTRRETLGMFGAASITAFVGCGDDGSTGTGPTAGPSTSAGMGGAGGASTGGAGGSGQGGGGGNTTSGGGGGASGGGGGSSDAGQGTGGTGADAGFDGGDVGQMQCAAKQETTVGPFPNIDPLDRRDIRGNTTGTMAPKEGVGLVLRMRVYDLDANCAPIAGAVVDVWSCDAVGVYAGYAAFNTAGQDFCRGYQRTDANGQAEFLMIFPGSYAGRAIHIHYSIQGTPKNLAPNAEGSQLPTTAVAQLYFPRAVVDEIFNSTAIYRTGAAITANESDGIYAGQGGRDLVVKMTKDGSGYIGEIDIGVHRADIGK